MTPLSTAAQIALVLLGILAVAGVVAMVVVVLQLRRIGRELERRAGPVLEKSRVVAGNLEYITAQVRTDVERMNDSVANLTSRLNQASDRMEERIEDFNALMEVLQGEAEGVFLDTASTVRGIRAGARSLADPEAGSDRRLGRPDPGRRDDPGATGGYGGRPGEEPDDDGSSAGTDPTEPDPARERSA